jgi:hypothetical protein
MNTVPTGSGSSSGSTILDRIEMGIGGGQRGRLRDGAGLVMGKVEKDRENI